ncbi:hypothetical protein NLG97_g6903 [Lecanicillium saksenae]|uniref:Uncharacterized protein n=1 Tax=Lecanicillium saksenae TaxID=468837 RepID=A0ACC1QPL2_9HYPO|nr:hypothetical protein NLG97_g6903 [Lecanicillium saksenae]
MDPCSAKSKDEQEEKSLTSLATAPPATAPTAATAASATAAATKSASHAQLEQQPFLSAVRIGIRPDFETKRKQRSISVTRYVGAD